MDMENKSAYPHPQHQGMGMPMPPTYEQSAYPPPLPHQHNPGMYPHPPQQGQTHHIHYVPPPTITEQPPPAQVIVTPQVGPDPQMLTCPSCRATIVTKMEYQSSTRTHVMAGLCCLFGCWLCCWMPYCMDSCRNGNHYCTNCGTFLGTYRS